MTYEQQQKKIQRQLYALKKVTKEATKSKAAAIKFLQDAGIMELIEQNSLPDQSR